MVVLGLFVVAFDEVAVLERRAGADERDEVWCVDGTPPGLGGLDELERHRDPGGAGAGSLGDPLPQPHGGEGGLEALLSSRDCPESCWCAGGVVPHAADDDVGELTFVAAAGRAFGLACGEASGDEGLRGFVHPYLGDVNDVQDAVDLGVPGEVEAVSSWLSVAFSG